MKKFIAFTLAEVLLTLMIIGVIASITIPAINQNAVDRSIATNLKKAYSELNQATSLVMTNNDSNKFFRTGVLDSQATFDTEFIKKYFNVMHECTAGSNKDCFGGSALVSDNSYLLSNGIALSFSGCIGLNEGGCNVFVDVNGPKPPNKGGRDQFLLGLNVGDGKVSIGKPSSDEFASTNFNTACESNDDYVAAWACAGKIMKDGWVIKY